MAFIKKTVHKKNTKKKTKKKERSKRRQYYKTYSNEALKEAISAIEKGASIRYAAKAHKIPVTTLFNKFKNNETVLKRSGPAPVLSKKVEDTLVSWIIYRAERGHPISKTDILDGVQRYVKETGIETPFNNGRPGRHWIEGFMKRYKSVLSARTAQNLIKDRADVCEQDLRDWFQLIRTHLVEKNLLDIHSSRIYNCDETSVQLCPKPRKVVVGKGSKTVYKVVDADEKDSLTALFMYSADGEAAPPMALFPYKEKVPMNIVTKSPKDWAVGISDNGWMTIESFYEYITNVFYPWLVKRNIQFPVILYLDGHSSHLTVPLALFCIEKQIELCSLFPHSTHLMQPLDVAFFHPLKEIWIDIVPRWKIENDKTRLKREDFASVLKLAVDKFTGAKNAVKNGFKATGLYPVNPDAPDYSIFNKKKKKRPAITDTTETSNEPPPKKDSNTFLKEFEEKLPPTLLEEFLQCERNNVWSGDITQVGLFEYWRRIKRESLGI